MDKDYKLESLKATMKFLKSQDPSIKLSSYNTKNKILDYLRSINYDMSEIKIKGPLKRAANKMFKFMAKGGSYKEPKPVKPKKPQYSLKELKKVMKFLKTQDKSIRILDYNSKKKILDYLRSINYDFSEIPQMVKDDSRVKLQLKDMPPIRASPMAAPMAAPMPAKVRKVRKPKAPKPPKKTKEEKKQESIRRQAILQAAKERQRQ